MVRWCSDSHGQSCISTCFGQPLLEKYSVSTGTATVHHARMQKIIKLVASWAHMGPEFFPEGGKNSSKTEVSLWTYLVSVRLSDDRKITEKGTFPIIRFCEHKLLKMTPWRLWFCSNEQQLLFGGASFWRKKSCFPTKVFLLYLDIWRKLVGTWNPAFWRKCKIVRIFYNFSQILLIMFQINIAANVLTVRNMQNVNSTRNRRYFFKKREYIHQELVFFSTKE